MNDNYLEQYAIVNNNLLPTFKLFPSHLDYKFDEMILGINVKPYGSGSEEAIQEVNFGPKGIVRCDGCKGYMNPMNRIIEGGSTFECCLCKSVSAIPSHYVPGAERSHMTYDILPSPEEFKSDFFEENPFLAIVIENTGSLRVNGF